MSNSNEQCCVSLMVKNSVIFVLSLSTAMSLAAGIVIKGYLVFRAVIWYGAY